MLYSWKKLPIINYFSTKACTMLIQQHGQKVSMPLFEGVSHDFKSVLWNNLKRNAKRYNFSCYKTATGSGPWTLDDLDIWPHLLDGCSSGYHCCSSGTDYYCFQKVDCSYGSSEAMMQPRPHCWLLLLLCDDPLLLLQKTVIGNQGCMRNEKKISQYV